MGSCYRFESFAKTDVPWLPSVPRAYILTLEGSDRLRGDPTASAGLGQLCAETVVQVNRDWRSCEKPDHVRTTAHDLIHAYRNVCRECASLDAPVLILEDDARIYSTDPHAYAEVDSFVRTRHFDVYSLGSFGEFAGREGAHRRYGRVMGFSQAVIWSARAREALLRAPAVDTHIDVHTLSGMAHKYTYHAPLVTQLFPTTENMATWCIECEGGRWERAGVRLWIGFLQGCLGLDRSPDGWRTLYWINEHLWVARHATVALLVLVLVAVCAALGMSVGRSRQLFQSTQ